MKIDELGIDLSDGVLRINLLEVNSSGWFRKQGPTPASVMRQNRSLNSPDRQLAASRTGSNIPG